MITYTLNELGTTLTGLHIQPGGGITFVPTETTKNWYESCLVLDRLGCGYCEKCGRRWYLTKESTGPVTAYGYGCLYCGYWCGTSYKNGAGKQAQCWSTFTGDQNPLPTIIGIGDNTWKGCQGLRINMVKVGQFLGLAPSVSWLVGAAPFGLEVLTQLFESGRSIVGKMLYNNGIVKFCGVDTYPQRIAYDSGWLVIDLTKHPIMLEPHFKSYVARMEIRRSTGFSGHWRRDSIKAAEPLVTDLREALAVPEYGTPENQQYFLRVLTRLGWNGSNREAWLKVRDKAIVPFGTPEDVLRERKVLRVR